ncbi:MAG: PaaI family thioesterase [Dehalococcoidia bacterium]
MSQTDPALLARLTERAATNTFWRTMGVEAVDAWEGYAKLRVPVRDDLRNADGAPVHGGVLAFLVDAAIGGALGSLHDHAGGGVGQATLDLNITYLGAVRDGAMVAEGRILRRGGSVAFGETEVRDEAGALLAKGRATYLILRPRS